MTNVKKSVYFRHPRILRDSISCSTILAHYCWQTHLQTMIDCGQATPPGTHKYQHDIAAVSRRKEETIDVDDLILELMY